MCEWLPESKVKNWMFMLTRTQLCFPWNRTAHLLDISNCVPSPLIQPQTVKPLLLNTRVFKFQKVIYLIHHALPTSNENFTNIYSSQNGQFLAINNLFLYTVPHKLTEFAKNKHQFINTTQNITVQLRFTTSATHWVLHNIRTVRDQFKTTS